MNIIEESLKRIIFLDGAMGTILQKRGLLPGQLPEKWNIDKQEEIIKIHLEYIEAGSDIINTNTFGGNFFKLKEYNLDDKVEIINKKGIEAALKAREKAKKEVWISASIGPTGKFLKPTGDISFDQMYEVYYQQVKACKDADIINFETATDIAELRIAVLAAKDAVKKPIIANLTFTENGRTLTGQDVITGFNILEGLGVDFVGTNCGMGPDDMAKILSGVNNLIDAKIAVQANAGIPKLINGHTVFTCAPDEYVDYLEPIVKSGVNIIGGCCGTTPEYIKKIISRYKDYEPKKITNRNMIKISSSTSTVIISKKDKFCKIGEKVNPSALKKVADDIRMKSTKNIKEIIKAQEEAGAMALDINLGLGGSNEKESFERVIPEISSFTRLPLVIDTTDKKALEVALKLYPGRALINSISGEKERMEYIIPLMKRYGAYAILLPLDENGIPDTVEKRINIIKNVLNYAEKNGVNKNRFIVDVLVMTVSAAPDFIKLSLETAHESYKRFGLHSIAGLSNVSFGLPARGAINSTFLSMLIGYGLDAAIINPQDSLINVTIDASNLLTGRDKNGLEYIKKYQGIKDIFEAKKESSNIDTKSKIELRNDSDIKNLLYNSIVKGDKDEANTLIKEIIKTCEAQEIVNNILIPAINYVGELYEKKIYFLPQLILSADAMKSVMSFLEPLLSKSSSEKKGKIVIATVKGDIHDIGKNIVSIMLSNYGFEVIDLGKDVAKETILETAIKENVDIIALSALMTTTMVEMENFINYMKEKNVNIPVMVGGAVLNEEYAKKIGAYYSRDGASAVKVANFIIENTKH
ncbi:MAG TPA: homocysteine S-methyltransferase family protein [Spirochaetota bacterium]|nr:homocysteine S-methyltransferase family protein [Spirochaetota bacterium]HOM38623.1 homocysteine S-methyltransferase family protein [Spirochaetota bacterium]HPQ49760.1 homocysteine S-methyltransferase family protein [Spirochaetota bacterium]